jgi:AhpD family alkylhydroperoxidase
MKKPFKRRLYPSVGDFMADLRATMGRPRQMRAVMRGDSLDPAFRERLMLAVTAVNGCRYCSYYHARQALMVGIGPEEAEALAAGVMDNCPPEQLPAMLYAQHWAESDARPDPAACDRIVELYGTRTTEAIELALHAIRIGNMAGNTFDYVLHRLSFGRWNVDRVPRVPLAATPAGRNTHR